MDLETKVRLAPLVGDGAMGTMLQGRGLKSGTPPDLLNLENPDLVHSVHAAYVGAGSDYIETNTFGANRLKLRHHGLDGKLKEIILEGVAIARSAAGAECLVAGSVGPTGVLLEPYGDASEAAVRDTYAEVAALMEQAGVDFFLAETMTDPREACIVIDAIREVSAKPVVATAVFAKGAKGYRTMMGNSPEDTTLLLVRAGATFTGTNCSSGIEDAVGIMKAMTSASSTAVIAQPNAGLPRLEAGALTYPESPETMAKGVPLLLALGVRMIGGCCGTTPAHTKAIARALGRDQ